MLTPSPPSGAPGQPGGLCGSLGPGRSPRAGGSATWVVPTRDEEPPPQPGPWAGLSDLARETWASSAGLSACEGKKK